MLRASEHSEGGLQRGSAEDGARVPRESLRTARAMTAWSREPTKLCRPSRQVGGRQAAKTRGPAEPASGRKGARREPWGRVASIPRDLGFWGV